MYKRQLPGDALRVLASQGGRYVFPMTIIDQLQQIRMLTIWPLVVGSVAFLAVRLVLKLASPINRVGKAGIWASTFVGILASVGAASISRGWGSGLTDWLAFTVGLAFLAIVLLMTVAVQALEDANA